MTDPRELENNLTTTLHARADATPAPPAPIGQLVAAGEHRIAVRRRRRGLVAVGSVAAAVVIAVAVPIGVRGHGAGPKPAVPHPAPTTLAGLPTGAPPKVPYLDGGALHVDGATIPTEASQVVAAGDQVLVGRADDGIMTWQVLRDGKLVFQPRLKNASQAQISPDGSIAVALSYPDREHTVLTIVDLATGKVRPNPMTLNAPYAPCCGGGQEVQIQGIDDDGTVYYASRKGEVAWRQGVFPAHLTRKVSAVAATPAGVVDQRSDFTGQILKADSQGALRKVADLPVDQGFTMSADGGLVAFSVPDQAAEKTGADPTPGTVLDLATGRTARLAIPADVTEPTPVAFEGDESVLVSVRAPGSGRAAGRHEVILRCAVDDGACERTVDLGPGNHADAVAGWRF